MKKYRYLLLLITFVILVYGINVFSADNGTKGDVNGDGKINTADYVLIRKSILKAVSLTKTEEDRADINNDGKISAADYILVRNKILNISSNNNENKYTITFDSSGGTEINNQSVSDGGKITKPQDPTRKGYTFIEWQLDGKAYDFNKTVTSNIKLVAIWVKLEKTTYEMKTNEKINISCIIEPSVNNITLTYSTNDKNVAAVNKKGAVTAIGGGNTTITVKANNKKVGDVETIVDYSFFETCATSKKDTKVALKTTKGNKVNVYSCIENQNWFHQGVAVTNDSIIYAGSAYQTWCKEGNTYELSKYNLKGKCNSADWAVALLVSGNKIRKFDKKTGKYIVNYIDVGGHGQAFDVTSNNEIYINYFIKLYLSSTYGYGAHNAGIAYVKNFSSDKSYIYPTSSVIFKTNGNMELYKAKNGLGTLDYLKEIINKGKESNNMTALEFGIDEEHDQIGVLKKAKTSNGNLTLYIYKLSDFIKGIKTLKNTYYFSSTLCAGGLCGHQGIEIYGNYMYSVQELTVNDTKYESVSKVKYTSCSKSDKSGASCEVDSLNIPTNKIGNEYGKKFVGLSETEGVSVYKEKVYISVMTNKFSDGARRNILLLLDGF